MVVDTIALEGLRGLACLHVVVRKNTYNIVKPNMTQDQTQANKNHKNTTMLLSQKITFVFIRTSRHNKAPFTKDFFLKFGSAADWSERKLKLSSVKGALLCFYDFCLPVFGLLSCSVPRCCL